MLNELKNRYPHNVIITATYFLNQCAAFQLNTIGTSSTTKKPNKIDDSHTLELIRVWTHAFFELMVQKNTWVFCTISSKNAWVQILISSSVCEPNWQIVNCFKWLHRFTSFNISTQNLIWYVSKYNMCFFVELSRSEWRIDQSDSCINRMLAVIQPKRSTVKKLKHRLKQGCQVCWFFRKALDF